MMKRLVSTSRDADCLSCAPFILAGWVSLLRPISALSCFPVLSLRLFLAFGTGPSRFRAKTLHSPRFSTVSLIWVKEGLSKQIDYELSRKMQNLSIKERSYKKIDLNATVPNIYRLLAGYLPCKLTYTVPLILGKAPYLDSKLLLNLLI
jgi:hypothetical protein